LVLKKWIAKLKLWEFNICHGSFQDIANGKYPLVKTLSFVSVKNRISAGAKAFVDFVKSREGMRKRQSQTATDKKRERLES
jgi:hypothetical protein